MKRLKLMQNSGKDRRTQDVCATRASFLLFSRRNGKGEGKKPFFILRVWVWKGSVAVWLSVYLILRQVVGERKDDEELAGKPKKIRGAAVDGEETEEWRRL